MNDFSACVEAAFQKTKALLLPFSKAIWLKLFILYLFAGGCSSGFGNIPANPSRFTDKSAAAPTAENLKNKAKATWIKVRPYIWSLLAAAIVGGLLLLVFGLWLSSRVQIITVRSLQQGVVEVRRLWRETAEMGQALFRFNLLIWSINLFVFVPPFLLGLWGIYHAIQLHSMSMGLTAGVGILVLIMFWLLAATVLWFLMRFLPVAMCEFNESPREGARRLWMWVRHKIWESTVWLFLYGVLAMAVGIMFAIVSAIVFLLAALVAVPATKIMGVIVAVPVAGVFILAVVIANTVPIGTFCTYLRMELMKKALA